MIKRLIKEDFDFVNNLLNRKVVMVSNTGSVLLDNNMSFYLWNISNNQLFNINHKKIKNVFNVKQNKNLNNNYIGKMEFFNDNKIYTFAYFD